MTSNTSIYYLPAIGAFIFMLFWIGSLNITLEGIIASDGIKREGLLRRVEKYSPDNESFPNADERKSVSSSGFTWILVGIIVGVIAPRYLAPDPAWTMMFGFLGAMLVFQIGLVRLFIFRFGNFAAALGFLGSAIMIHAEVITQPILFVEPGYARVLVLLILVFTSRFIGRGFFIYPSANLDIPFPLRERQDNLVRYTMGALSVLLTIMEFINIMYELFFKS